MKRIKKKVLRRTLDEKLAVIDRFNLIMNGGGREKDYTQKVLESDPGKIQEVRDARQKLRADYLEVTREAVPNRLLVPTHSSLGGGLIAERAFPLEFSHSGLSVIGSDESDDPCEPVDRDFSLKLKVNDLSGNWNTSTVQYVNGGVMGWSTELDRTPTISNMNGKGRISGTLELKWSENVPEDGIYLLKPELAIWLSGYCFADGYVGWETGPDAKATVSLITMVTLDNWIVSFHNEIIQQAKSLCLANTKSFSRYLLLLSEQIGLEARKGQELAVRVRVGGITWTRNSADAEVGINLFGAIANVPSDTDIPVNG